jgi:hypothetical protein
MDTLHHHLLPHLPFHVGQALSSRKVQHQLRQGNEFELAIGKGLIDSIRGQGVTMTKL